MRVAIALMAVLAFPVLAEQAADYYGKAPISLDYPAQALPGKAAPSFDQFELPAAKESTTTTKTKTKKDKQLASN